MYADFFGLTEDLCADECLCRMKSFCQHGTTSTYDHCVNVAFVCFLLNRKLRLGADERALVRGALLHDYFLYDWHATSNKAHAINHPSLASQNARRDFPDITPKELNIIESHMWPLPPQRVPSSREAWLVCVADKWCSLKETLRRPLKSA